MERERRVPRALPARVAARCDARAPEHRHDLRRGRGRRRPLPRDAVRARHRPRGAARPERSAQAGKGGARAPPARRGAGGGAAAPAAAPAAGLVHRDVKPANVMVDGQRSYLTDFGLTKRTTADSAPLTATGQFFGTVDYVAPEQIQGAVQDGRVDVYALGCVLFECLTGTRPYVRDAQLSVIYAHLNDPPPRVSERRPELPPAFDGVIATAMAKAPEQRSRTCMAIIDAARDAVSRPAPAPSVTAHPPPDPPTP